MVQFVDWLLGVLQTALNMLFYAAPSRLFAKWRNKGEPWLYFNYIYVAWWTAIIVGFVIAAPYTSGWGQLVMVALALWRVAEILTWYIKLLFDKGHRVFLEVERNLLFLIGDGFVLMTALALLLETERRATYGAGGLMLFRPSP